MDPIKIVVVYPASGSAQAVWESAAGFMSAWSKPHGQDKATAAVTVVTVRQNDPQSMMYARRIGYVKGNVKFSYVVF
jgi:hypothetical protein